MFVVYVCKILLKILSIKSKFLMYDSADTLYLPLFQNFIRIVQSTLIRECSVLGCNHHIRECPELGCNLLDVALMFI